MNSFNEHNSPTGQSFAFELGIFSGAVIAAYTLPHIPQVTESLVNRANPHLRYLKEVVITNADIIKRNAMTFMESYQSSHGLVRLAVKYIPPRFFGTTPRVYIFVNNMTVNTIINKENNVLDENEFMNDDGDIVAFVRDDDDSDTETWLLNEDTFDRGGPKCSTPKTSMARFIESKRKCQRYLNITETEEKTKTNFSSRLDQIQASLELLSEAMIQQRQTNLINNVNPPISNNNNTAVAVKVMPPPPPPPFPTFILTEKNTNKINLPLKVKLENKEIKENINVKNDNSNSRLPLSLTEVLSGLKNVKLRPTPRSPGGTPARRPPKNSLDQEGGLLYALKKRYDGYHGDKETDSEDENEKENASFNDTCFDS